jgi:hypothetical protein
MLLIGGDFFYSYPKIKFGGKPCEIPSIYIFMVRLEWINKFEVDEGKGIHKKQKQLSLILPVH